jgi:hypothetical protein
MVTTILFIMVTESNSASTSSDPNPAAKEHSPMSPAEKPPEESVCISRGQSLPQSDAEANAALLPDSKGPAQFNASGLDPDLGPLETELQRCDADHQGLNPDPVPYGAYEPTPEDIAWLNDQPTAEDWREYREWCRKFDARLEALRMERDSRPEFPGVISPGLARFLAYGNIHE